MSAFEVTEERRRQAESLAGMGLPHDMIALVIGCDPKTLRKHFDHDLKVGEAKATAKVAQTLFSKAIGGDTACLIFWMKARAKWSEKQVVEHQFANDPRAKSDAELRDELARLSRTLADAAAGVASPAVPGEHDGMVH